MPTPNTSATTSPRTREALKNLLQRWEPAAGADGFEGLVAHALANLSGFTFRLARSGSQFGRDGATTAGQFSIAMEAKRYRESVPLQELVGKSALAAFELADDVDVWVLAATVEVSEPTQRRLQEILERGGITLLTLDWARTGIPPLATLLAATRDSVLIWARSRLSRHSLGVLRAGLNDILAEPDFDRSLEALEACLSPSTLGLDALRCANGRWCGRHFSDRRLAQTQFSQFLAPLDGAEPRIARPRAVAAIGAAIEQARLDTAGDTLVAVLGSEGSGKTWAVTNWWLANAGRPILLLSVGRMADHLVAGDEPIDMLARLAAHQDGTRDQRSIDRWRRRLERWSQPDAPRDRFIVLIDGLNETSGKPWSTVLQRLLPATRDLGGVIVATCRRTHWDREIAARLPFINFQRVAIGDYDDDEFDAVFSQHHLDGSSLTPQLNRFMRNPRICALALRLLPQLAAVEDLSVDRLLLEYWRARLLERGDLVGHDDLDLRNLLIAHAREYRARPGTDFNRDEWRTRSGAASRGDGRELANDLSDIEEGRFFDGERGTYQFRPEALHFALGLLVADEVRQAVRLDAEGIDEALGAILDPIRGFDTVANVLLAAIAVASLDAGYPDGGVAALIRGWISLQNLNDDAFEDLIPYLAARPEPFLDAFETRDMDSDDGRFLRLILCVAKLRDPVAGAIDRRVEKWLGTWSRGLPAGGDADGDRQARYNAEVDSRIALLSEEERRFLGDMCQETDVSRALADTAACYLLGRPQAVFARGILAFALTHKLVGRYQSTFDDLSWAIRLNRLDHPELAQAVGNEVRDFLTTTASDIGREVGATCLSLLGTVDAEDAADRIRPRTPWTDRREVCNPLDPASEAPDDAASVTVRVAALEPTELWNHMGPGSEDHDLERSTNLLVRFAPDEIISKLNQIAETVSSRTGLALRQLGWRLPRLSPILRSTAIDAIRTRITEMQATPTLAPDGDLDFVMGMMVESVMPSLTGPEQLDLLISLPPDAPFYFRYAALAKPVPEDEATARLDALMNGDARVRERAIIFLAFSGIEASPVLLAFIAQCLSSDDAEIVAAAAEFARTRHVPELDDAVLGLPIPDDDDMTWRAGVVRGARSNAIVRRCREDLIETIPVEHLDFVATHLPAARERLADTIEATVEHLTVPRDSEVPIDAIVTLEITEDGRTHIDLEDRGRGRPTNFIEAIDAINEEMSDHTGERFANRRRLLGKQLDRFLSSLVSARALMIARRPYTQGLSELARQETERYGRWLRRILDTADERALRQIQTLGLALAQNYAEIDGELAARTFVHLWRIDPHVTVTIGAAKHPLRYLALFSAASCPEIDGTRSAALASATNDEDIARLIAAAEASGATAWLERFAEMCLASDAPSDHALAITIASLRSQNPHSQSVLGRDWRSGFLGGAAEIGRERYDRAIHADHWFASALAANDPHHAWLSLQLGVAAADRRHLLNPVYLQSQELRLMGGDTPQQLTKAVEKAGGERKRTFFGMKRPSGLLEDFL